MFVFISSMNILQLVLVRGPGGRQHLDVLEILAEVLSIYLVLHAVLGYHGCLQLLQIFSISLSGLIEVLLVPNRVNEGVYGEGVDYRSF